MGGAGLRTEDGGGERVSTHFQQRDDGREQARLWNFLDRDPVLE
jgi:hypothetical protein